MKGKEKKRDKPIEERGESHIYTSRRKRRPIGGWGRRPPRPRTRKKEKKDGEAKSAEMKEKKRAEIGRDMLARSNGKR